MFVKLLALLISNVFVSFSVLMCCRSLAWKCGLKDGIEQRTNLVLISALERTCDRARRDKIERACTRAQGTRDRVQDPQSSACHISRISCVALAAIASPPVPWELWSGYVRSSAPTCDLAHIGLRLSAWTCDRAHPCDRHHIIFVINRTLSHFCKVMFGGALRGLKPLYSSL